MDHDDDDVADFLIRYAEACIDVGIEPLPIDALKALAEALLTETIAGSRTLQ